MTKPANPHDVKPGQIWRDNDPRSRGRKLTVVEITGAAAIVRGSTGRATRVRLDRFRPSSTGYRLVQDVDDAGRAAANDREDTDL